MRRISTLVAAVALAIGCSSGSKPSISEPKADPKLASVTFRVAFPSGAVKSLIDPATTEIELYVTSPDGYSATEYLTPDAPTRTLLLPPGYYYFGAYAYDDLGNGLEAAGSAGRLVPGANQVVISFVNGDWTLVDPVTLSNGTVVEGFSLVFDENQEGWPFAFDPGIPFLSNAYYMNYRLSDGQGGVLPPGTSRVRHYTQTAGGIVNRSAFDGGGYSLTNACGEANDQPYLGSCPGGDGPPAPGERWIRVIGATGDEGGCRDCSYEDQLRNDALRKLLPRETYDPDIGAVSNTRVVTGTQIAGTLIEYEFASGSFELVTGITGPPQVEEPATSAAPDADFVLTVSSYREALLCRDGFNGTTPNGTVETGDWNLFRSDCSSGPCVPTTESCGVDLDEDGEYEYYQCGYPEGPDAGECSYGLVPGDPGDLGEFCDGWWDEYAQTCNGPGDGVALPWEFHDMNGDGVVETGSFYFTQAVAESFTVVGHAYSFTANGAPLDRNTEVVIQ
jgi:hypothetical protein